MTTTPPTPLPEISEHDAAGAIKDIYDALRRTVGVPVVASIYRHLATFPGVLEWMWAALGPALETGGIQARGQRLNETAEIGRLPPLSPDGLMAAGLTNTDLHAITNVLDSYNRMNPVNILCVHVLRNLLGCAAPSGAAPRDDLAQPPPSITQEPLLDLPPIIAIADLPQDLRALITQLASPGVTADDAIVPGLYRHLGHWPAYLHLAGDALLPSFRSGQIEVWAAGVRTGAGNEAAVIAAQLGGASAPPSGLSQDQQNDLVASLDAFAGRIPEMVVVGTLLRRALPE